MLAEIEHTCNPQEADDFVMILSAVRKFEYIRIYESQGHWCWQHVHVAGKLAKSSTERFSSALAAAHVGAIIASTHGIPAILPTGLQPELVALWNQIGQQKFDQGYEYHTCWNSHMREGYLAAMEESETERSATEPMYTDWQR